MNILPPVHRESRPSWFSNVSLEECCGQRGAAGFSCLGRSLPALVLLDLLWPRAPHLLTQTLSQLAPSAQPQSGGHCVEGYLAEERLGRRRKQTAAGRLTASQVQSWRPHRWDSWESRYSGRSVEGASSSAECRLHWQSPPTGSTVSCSHRKKNTAFSEWS